MEVYAMKFLRIMMVLVLLLCLCACGGNTAEPTSAPEQTEQPAVTDILQIPTEEQTEPAAPAYTVTVVDQDGNPIAGALVQLCMDSCYPAATDEQGVARYQVPEGDYKVSFLTLPAGYAYSTEEDTFYFEAGSTEMTIVLQAVTE